MNCRVCGAPMWSAVEGLLCSDCGAMVPIEKTRSWPVQACPVCRREMRPRLDGPGFVCECGYTPPEAMDEEEVPYRSARQALALFLSSRSRAGGISMLGPMLQRLEEGMVQTSTREQFSRALECIGDLSAAWDELDGEQRIVLEHSARVPDWQEKARRCRKCATEYGPTASRCARCQRTYLMDEPSCPHCGDHRSFPVWPARRDGDGCEIPGAHPACPKCNASGAKTWDEVAGKSKQIAKAVSEHRIGLFIQERGRAPFGRGGEFNEEGLTGYCPVCGTFYTAHRAGERYERDKLCRLDKSRIRWGLRIGSNQVQGLVSGAIGRWKHVLLARKLI